ncbi:hypothetical protein [Dickeya solani]|uniref:Bacteriophage protein n=1 Tax=Dickeya solani TaxID=1089444 RepID=A0ABU4EH08_9GAMM|nr:hypothetical protein [Dickeya solani]MCA6999493.1 hypothetical protein [Dickeya solani]MCZ0823833.1 hypothetical protein [Dickeya solani]MDV6996223.1 hypothetical protein [Dickeya solani]MDV7005382.1 hypothetical protein [Dickeya solani]MDV7037578.1 hypothetical protein [Dickeya solani]
MKSGLTVKFDKSDAILKALQEIGKRDVLVGIPSDRATRDDGAEINNAELGYLHSYGGTIRIPEHDVTIYRQTDKNGDLLHDGRFVKSKKSNLATTHHVNAYTVTLPPRPFLELGIQAVRAETLAMLKRAAVAVFDGSPSTAEQYLNRAGTLAANSAKNVITSGDQLAPLESSTIRSRASRGRTGIKPLYDTGGLLRSITYIVRDKNAVS